MKRWLRKGLILFFCALFFLSAWMLLAHYQTSRKQQAQFDALSQIVAQSTTAPIPNTDKTQEQTSVPDMPAVLPEYAALFSMNPDFAGWLQIDGTVINYPVMQTPDCPNYYLYRDFYGEPSDHGCLYARESCNLQRPSDNIIIYGHHMKDGSMFADLANYRNHDFWADHPLIYFHTLTQRHTYEIFAVFITTANEGQGFSYHKFVDAQDPSEFIDFVTGCKSLSLYDTGIIPVFGDKLLTLSTCEYTRDNGRLVVVAKQVN